MKIKRFLAALGLMATCSPLFADGAFSTKTPVNGYPAFALGADVSWTSRIEDNNLYTYYRGSNASDTEITSIPAMTSDYGLDAVRLRVWVNPSNAAAVSGFSFKVGNATYSSTSTQGYGSANDMVSLARRFAAQGQRLMVAFHLSDTWADPARQFIPAEWADCTTAEQLKERVVSHVTEVLTLLHNANVNVAWVQIGNETNTGMLKYQLPSSTAGTTTVKSVAFGCEIGSNSTTTKNFVTVFKAAAEAAKAVYPDTKTVLHLAKASKWSDLNWTLSLLKNAGLSTDICDLIGLSLYPGIDDGRDSYTAEWQKYTDTGIENIGKIYSTYGYRTILCEIGMNNEYTSSIDLTGVAADKQQAACIEQCNKDVRDFTQYLIDNLRDKASTCDGLFYWEPEGDYLDSYLKGACVSITPDADWSRDKVTANDYWKVCRENSTFPDGGLKDYTLNQSAEATPLYIVGGFNSWNYTAPAEFDYSAETGLYTFTADCTGENGKWLSVSTDKSSESGYKAAQLTPTTGLSNGVTVNLSKSTESFAVPYAATWQITVNTARGTINLYTTDTDTEGGYEALYLYAYDKSGGTDSKTELATTDGTVYSATGATFPNASTNLDVCITNSDWTSVWRSPAGQWFAVERDKEVSLTKGGTNQCYVWGWTLASSDYIWFNAESGKLLISTSSECPWEVGGTGTEYSITYDNTATQWDAVYAYILDADGNQLCGVWPGMRMTSKTDAEGIWQLVKSLTTAPATVSFSNGLNRTDTFTYTDGKQYPDATGISSVASDNADGSAAYYNLQGIRVRRPMSGVYIVKRGNTVKKAVFK